MKKIGIFLTASVPWMANMYKYKHQFPVGAIILIINQHSALSFLHLSMLITTFFMPKLDVKEEFLIQKLEGNSLNLPNPEVLPGRHNRMPYVFVADEAFPLKDNILKPYPGSHQKGSPKRLSRARRIVENVFGILSAVFRVLRKPMLLEPHKAEKVIMACIYLHNYLRKNQSSKNVYSPNGSFDSEINGQIIEGLWRQFDGQTGLISIPKIARKSAASAEKIRAEFAEYFTSNGSVPWQNDYA